MGEAQFGNLHSIEGTIVELSRNYWSRSSSGQDVRPTTRSKWQASLNTRYLFKLDRGSLIVKGIIFDSLTGLSSTYSGLPGSISNNFSPELQNVYSLNRLNPISSRLFEGVYNNLPKYDTTVLKVLFYLLSYMHPFGLDTIRNGYKTRYLVERLLQFSKCWPLPPIVTPQSLGDITVGRVWTWFEQNQSFVILGKTLGHWMRLIPRTPEWPEAGGLSPSLEAVDAVLHWNMRLSVTQKGYLSWTVERARAGDSIAILLGCSVPVILRPGPDGSWCVVGDAIIYGIMDGEAFAYLPPVDDWGSLTLH
jgi:hypothetical protein